MTDTPPVRRSPVPPSECNLWKAFGLIGDRWILVILQSPALIRHRSLSGRIAEESDANLSEIRQCPSEQILRPDRDEIAVPSAPLPNAITGRVMHIGACNIEM